MHEKKQLFSGKIIDAKKSDGNNHTKLVNNTRTSGILNNNATGGSPLSPNSNTNSNTSDSKTNSLFKKVSNSKF